MVSLPNEIDIANVSVIRIGHLAAAGMQTVIEDPGKIVPVDDPENQSFVRIECRRHRV
jgi:hypothetical protein